MQSSDTTCNSRVKTEIVASSNRNLLSATRQSSCHQQKIQLSHFIFLSQGHTYFRLILNKLQIIFYLGKITGDQIVFHDGPKRLEQPLPSTLHFRSQTLQDYGEGISMAWTKCLTEFEAKRIQLPLPKIKVFEGKKSRILRNEGKNPTININ